MAKWWYISPWWLIRIVVDEGNKQVCESDAVGVLIDMIKTSNKDDNFLIEAMGLIGRAYLYSEKNKLSVITSGLIAAVIAIMSSSRNPNLKLACFNLLIFVSNPEGVKYETRPTGTWLISLIPNSFFRSTLKSVLNAIKLFCSQLEEFKTYYCYWAISTLVQLLSLTTKKVNVLV